ncbi:hypothetical protein [Azohydromonas aeria]|uniref:hypothetical protein n=1 Tax=Azohydromonas aeria TaxID=2590212 RepID=UPI0012F7A026|nr:hypothetical protein [Azohydromonas aeria]
MKILRGIDHPFAGEQVLACVPAPGPYARAGAGEPALRKRLNFFPQRSLTHTALTEEQRSRIDAVMRLAQAVSPGVVSGLELSIEGSRLVVLPGHAVAPDGADLELAYPLHIAFDAISVISPRVDAALDALHGADPAWARAAGLRRQASLAQVLSELSGAAVLPHAMVLVAVPRTIALDRSAAADSPCPNATDGGATSRAAWEDGFQLAWVPWPEDRALPPWSSDGSSVDARFRNRLAYAVFNAERQRLSIEPPGSMRAWLERAGLSQAGLDALAQQAAQRAALGQPWPWESLGVPLSIVAFDGAFKPVFADRGTVVRQGGGRRNRSALVPSAGDDVLWQARVAQWLEHLAELPPAQRQAHALQQQFDWLPPAGVLPLSVADFRAARQGFFPPHFDVQAQPVPLDMVDALIKESAPLLPFNLSLRDQVQLLVPVPASHYDPELLQLDPAVNPLFDLEIARLTRERLRLLTRRDALRRRFDVLTRAVAGSWPRYAIDDPNALPDEAGGLAAQGFARIHRSRAPAGGSEEHGFSGAQARLAFQASDEFFVYVRLDTPVRAIAVRLAGSGEPPDAAVPERAFAWGDLPGQAQGQRIGALPPVGTWTRLSLPMSLAGLAGSRIDALTFAVLAGREPAQVSWGHAGRAGSGSECYWVGDALPPGARPGSAAGWEWVEQGDAADAAEDLGLGLPIVAPAQGDAAQPPDAHARRVGELDALRDNWRNFRNGVLMGELGEPAGGRTATTPPRTVDGGLDELIQRLDGRIRAANDHVDFGFLRARVDLFRVRQSVLGTDDAGRFLTSPAAAELVRRNENPVATEKEFAEYFQRLNQKAAPSPYPPSPAPAPASAPSATPAPNMRAAVPQAEAAAPAPLFMADRLAATTSPQASARLALSAQGGALFGSTVPASALTPVAAAAAVSVSRGLTGEVAMAGALERIDLAGPRVGGGISGAVLGETVRAQPLVKVATVKPVRLSAEVPPAVKDVVGASLVGATYNTVTVAERFSLPASVVTSNVAATGKDNFVRGGLAGLKAAGLAVDDLPVYGYQKGSGSDARKDLTAAELLAQDGVSDTDNVVDNNGDQHESVYFRRSVDAIDNAIRFLRGMELRAEDYRRLQADAKSARERITAATTRLQALLGELALRLAEVRHDLSVARSLREEEAARLAALVARRRAVLEEQVPFLVFRRPRFTLTAEDVPRLEAQPADVADPVPRCRGDAHDAPAELLAMVDTLRDVPVRWLLPIVRAFPLLDRVADLDRVIVQAQQRVLGGGARAQAAAALVVSEGAGTATGTLLGATFARHLQRLADADDAAAVRMARFDAASWRQAIEPAQHIVSIRDLLQAGMQRRELGLAAAGLLDDVAGVAACMHAAFCTVPPATRLRWAELFSQLDPAVSLRQLTVLPGFGRESLGVDYIAWRQMQRMVDWLFTQVSDDDAAQQAVNDLVRVCLLLSAHAPVRRILSARIRRPVPAVVNTRLDIAIDPRVTRIGMQVLVHEPRTQTLLARAVVEDLAEGVATARITHAPAGAAVTLDASLSVQVQAGPPLTTAAVQRAEAAAVKADVLPAAAREPAAKGATPVAQAAPRAEKQLQALRQGAARAARMR